MTTVIGIVRRPPQSSGVAVPPALTPFSFMWAATQLLDLLCFPEWVFEPSGVLLFLSAVAVLIKPSASQRVLLMCVSSLIYLYVRSPITPNHILFEGFVNLTILLVAIRHLQRPRDAARAAVFHEAVPVLRGLLLALYAFSFLHKLNWAFLTPATSCAGFILDGIADRVGMIGPGDSMKVAAVWATLIVEGGIPLLLIFPRTRRVALLVAWPFHFALAFHPRPGIYGFSSMLFAMLILFLPDGFYAKLYANPTVRAIAKGHACRALSMPRMLGASAALATLLAGAIVLSGVDLSVSGTVWIRRAGMLLWLPYATALLTALLIGWSGARGESTPGFLVNTRRSPAVAVLLLFFLNCMAPYLGFQTVRAMSMFSNLRTEGDRTNHLFMPSGLQIADYQKDLVRPIAASDAWLEFYADNESLLPFTELRRRAWENRNVPVQVTYERGGRIETLDTSKAGAERQVSPLPFPLHKILAFREVDQDGRPSRCLW